MSDKITITLSRDEALVLLEFFGRFDGDDNDFTLRHNAEFIAFMRIAGQLENSLGEVFDPKYDELVSAARSRLADGYEGFAPGVHGGAG